VVHKVRETMANRDWTPPSFGASKLGKRRRNKGIVGGYTDTVMVWHCVHALIEGMSTARAAICTTAMSRTKIDRSFVESCLSF